MKHEHSHEHTYRHDHAHAHEEGMQHLHRHEHTAEESGMKHMALTEQENKDLPVSPGGGENKGPRYPWGLKISLTKTEMEKLGIKDLPPVGGRLSCELCGEVVSADKEGTPRFTLQITHMDLCEDGDDNDPAAERDARIAGLYGKQTGS